MSKRNTATKQKQPAPVAIDAPIPYVPTDPKPEAIVIRKSTTIGEIMDRRYPGLTVGPKGYTWDELVIACAALADDAVFDLTLLDHEKSRRPLLVALVALAHDALDAFDRRFATAKGGAR